MASVAAPLLLPPVFVQNDNAVGEVTELAVFTIAILAASFIPAPFESSIVLKPR
jgi:hypothetical protein